MKTFNQYIKESDDFEIQREDDVDLYDKNNIRIIVNDDKYILRNIEKAINDLGGLYVYYTILPKEKYYYQKGIILSKTKLNKDQIIGISEDFYKKGYLDENDEPTDEGDIDDEEDDIDVTDEEQDDDEQQDAVDDMVRRIRQDDERGFWRPEIRGRDPNLK